MSLSKDYDTTVHQLFPELIKQLENEFTPKFNFNDYHIMIVHPWQLDDVLHSDYQAEVDKELIIEAKHTLDYYAGLSFRTLVPKYQLCRHTSNCRQTFILQVKFVHYQNKRRTMVH